MFNQICYLSLTTREKRLLKYLIDSLDDNGYLSLKIEEIIDHLFVPVQEVLDGLSILQSSLEPCGVGARSLQECLLLQLKKLQPRDLMQKCGELSRSLNKKVERNG
ncbi:hypothetical protein KHA80_13640 [Anaerobacillus sp. HL2]|nr:hypothetical protein KHA80_13640 [Anaerobacillus sp. HL2]